MVALQRPGASPQQQLEPPHATNEPGAPREFVTPFGLNQPGVHVALKVFVILTKGNEAGSAAMFVQRPLAVAA